MPPSKERYGTVDTHLGGVQLRVEPGVQLDILRKTIDDFYQLARDYALTKWQIDELTPQQNSRNKEIKSIAMGHEGLRGLTSEGDNVSLIVYPSEGKATWDLGLLRKSLGDVALSAFVQETLLITISIPIGYPTKDGTKLSESVILKAIGNALSSLGIPRKDLASLMQHQVKIEVGERLTEMVDQGQIELLPDTRKTPKPIWNVRVDRLEKSGKAKPKEAEPEKAS